MLHGDPLLPLNPEKAMMMATRKINLSLKGKKSKLFVYLFDYFSIHSQIFNDSCILTFRRRVQSVSTFLDSEEGTKAIPRSQFLSTDGVGGRGALYGGDDDHDAPTNNTSSSSSIALRGKKEKKVHSIVEEGSADTDISSESVQSALCAAGIACKAVDVVMCSKNTNAFACIRYVCYINEIMISIRFIIVTTIFTPINLPFFISYIILGLLDTMQVVMDVLVAV